MECGQPAHCGQAARAPKAFWSTDIGREYDKNKDTHHMTTTIHPQTTMGRVHLTVANLNRSLAYYQQGIGLKLLYQNGQTAKLGTENTTLLILTEQPNAQPTRGTTGLYHFALLVPSRQELARTLKHFVDAAVPILGASDHAVSEALYLTDPDGHGIEIYRDRPRQEWSYPNGNLKLVTEPFDADGVLGELGDDESMWTGLHADTKMGHVHLHVNHIPAAEQFYRDLLGFEVMARYGAGASFVAAGSYHHHLGLNTWAGVGAPSPAEDSARLLWYEIVLPDTAVLNQLIQRIKGAGLAVGTSEYGRTITDPAGNTILLTAS